MLDLYYNPNPRHTLSMRLYPARQLHLRSFILALSRSFFQCHTFHDGSQCEHLGLAVLDTMFTF